MSNENLNCKKDDEQESYDRARVEKRKGETQPSKISDWPIVAFVEKDGVVYPVYRENS